MLTVTGAPFDPEDALSKFRNSLSDSGAVVTFTGLVRGEGAGAQLFLQHYSGYTEQVISSYTDRVAQHFGINAWRIIHRVGMMMPRDPIVFVATAARHRRAAFEAADCLMDMLKSRAPFWKKEIADGHGIWIEPRQEDHEDLMRWKDILGAPL